MVSLQDISIIQGGMGIGVSLSNLAGAVMKEGGMGTISAAHPGYREKDFWINSIEANCRALKQEIQKAKDIACGKGMLAVNIMVASKDYASYVKASVEAKTDAIISGAGLALRLPEYVGKHPTLLAPIVSSAKALRLICTSWKKRYQRMPDFVVIEGAKAGGHLGFKEDELEQKTYVSNDTILKEVLDYLDSQQVTLPVFVAGGIYDSTDIEHVKSLGAQGVQMGTRFIATHECDAHDNFKKMVVNCTKEDIVLMQSPTGFCARAINNEFVQKVNHPIKQCIQCLTKCDHHFCITEALIQAVQGDTKQGLFFVGENADRIDRMMSVHELMEELVCQ